MQTQLLKEKLKTFDPLMFDAREFRRKFQIQDGFCPQSLKLQASLIAEEAQEVAEAVKDLDERLGHLNDHRARKTHLLKELGDLVYVCYQMAAAFDWDLTEACTRIHNSNLSKLSQDGEPIRREDGKILKGPNYYEPDLSDLV